MANLYRTVSARTILHQDTGRKYDNIMDVGIFELIGARMVSYDLQFGSDTRFRQ